MTNVQAWFETTEVATGIFAIEEPFHVERVKSYLVTGEDRAILLDTGMGVANVRDEVERLTSLPVTVINSHAHWDHIGGNALFDDILIHPAEADELLPGYPNERMRGWFSPEMLTGPLPPVVTAKALAISPSRATGFVNEGDVVDLGTRRLSVLHCPGHSPGGIVLLDSANGILFSTDLAYDGYLYAYRGRALETYRDSLRRLAALAPDLRILLPSHNATPVSPALLRPQAEALQQILDGAEPVTRDGDRETYRFGDVGVYLFPERYAE